MASIVINKTNLIDSSFMFQNIHQMTEANDLELDVFRNLLKNYDLGGDLEKMQIWDEYLKNNLSSQLPVIDDNFNNNFNGNLINNNYLDDYDNLSPQDASSSKRYFESIAKSVTTPTQMPQTYTLYSMRILLCVGLMLLVLVVLMVMLIMLCRRHSNLNKYQSIPNNNTSGAVLAYDYIYRPLHGNRLDDEYENTFVGVSIPLLQEVTVV